MRYVPTFCVKEGMKLGKNIYSDDGVVLLANDVILTKEYINSIVKLGINGVYIDDSISQDIQIKNVISDDLRIKAVKSIKNVFNNPKIIMGNLNTVEVLAQNILSEILKNKSVMVNMIDIKNYDNYLYSHSVNVAVLSSVIGIGLNLDKRKLEKLIVSALLHDVGKVFLPREILEKDNRNKKEEEVYKGHSEKGYNYIKRYQSIPITTYVGILHHHERYDGKGYPDKRKGEKISLFGRIISICDAYDNIVSPKSKIEVPIPSEAIEYIMGNNGSIFDPKLVKIFLSKVAPYPLGSILKLSNGEKVIVVENNEVCSIRPKVKSLETNKIYDLTRDWNTRNITIVSVEKE